MLSKLSKSAEKVQAVLNEFGYELNVVELPDSTRTAQEAADAIGCTVSQIAKSLIFKGKVSQKPILIIASGTNRINEKAIKEITGEKLEKADADFVLEHTGFAIGGIPPLGHKNTIATFIDEDLLQYEEIWAAAGTPHAVFRLTPKILSEITKGNIINVK
ncbi:Cys-tRNA(Pro)/Cys-tRNA(Cys) deacylase YbaK [Oxobacter pfennigii]|uniref:Cys-tRNA(Pro)/Cys-tRNA(Cys) deacylase YbaK n=1 Tax=Oxobacter pfennigii TaxID=36849 RepID=A0A0P9AK42_9CLOT|nr:YbaK/EbsC family protein [Oxobacter pfennigii]KPU45738.1 Cys-tRNA(Pro)/Cys-tRNA(Cys) deacylase YbaK [Oxobacter pfennigii]